MKNKKGFTLVELLAVLVILGILMGIAIPAITRLIGDNKTKTYINDAKKLVARAETVVNSKNTVIEKPDPGDCIVFSLGYLDDGSFDSSPYKDKDGEYMDEASFVVLKNNGGNYLYTVILVEKYNTSSYRGVNMSSLEQLSQSGYKSRVGNIETSHYGDINIFTIDDLNETKLNDFYDDTLAAASIDGDIVDCYRYEGSDSSSSSEGYQKLKTKIESIDISSSLNSENHTLLNIKTNIIPGSLNNMWVCAIVTDTDEPTLNKNFIGTQCEENGGKIEQVLNTTKSNPVNFEFDKGEISGQKPFWVQIYVGKLVEKGNYSSKNEARQKKKYVVNADLPPVIEKLDIDQKNIYLNVSDDVTDKNELLVAIFNDNIDCADVNYNKTYGELFNDKKYQHNYTEDKNVYICLKDKKGNISKRGEVSFKYINPNSSPKISRFEILPNTKSSPDGVFKGNSFDTELILEVSDDYYSWNDIKISYREVENNSNIDCNSIYNSSINKYSDFKNNRLKYKFSGTKYDGSQKNLLLCAYNPNYNPNKNNYASATATYKIYEPVRLEDENSFSIKSKESNYNSNEVTIKIDDNFNIKTDFVNDSKIDNKEIISYCYKNITQGSDQICSERMTFSSFKELFSNNEFYFTLENSTQNGDMYDIGIIIYDPITNEGKEYFKNYILYKACSEMNNNYSYTLSDDIYTDGNNNAITTDLCDGMCYDGYKDIKAYYFENLQKYDNYLKDKNGNPLICSTPENNKKEVGCGFYTCVGNIGDVRYNVLGNTLRTVEEKDYWDEEFDGKTYKCTGYYKLYKTTVNNDRSIAQPYNGCRMGVCKEIYEANMEYFKYNKNDTKEPYYKVDDVLDGGPFIVINDSKFTDSNACIN